MKTIRNLTAALMVLFLAPLVWAQSKEQPRSTVLRLMLLGHPSVQADLQLADDQVQRVREFTAKQRLALQEVGKATGTDARTKLADMDKQGERFITLVLKPDQARRLRQLTLQVGGPFAFHDPEITNTLQLTNDQQEKMQLIEGSARRQIRELLQAGGNRDEARRKALEILRTSKDKLVALLSMEQTARWEKLIGRPFKGELPTGIPPAKP